MATEKVKRSGEDNKEEYCAVWRKEAVGRRRGKPRPPRMSEERKEELAVEDGFGWDLVEEEVTSVADNDSM